MSRSSSYEHPAAGRGRKWGGIAVLMTAAILAALAWLASSHPATASVRHVRASARPHATAPIAFSHAVVVDEQRPGFEPDVKVAPDGTVYSSVPNGFSTTISYVWDSRDGANSYQPVPGTIGPGKPETCIGGGDSDLFVDPDNALYFSDLQGLTNISNSVSTDGGASWSTNCAGAPNTPDDRMWFAGTGSLAKGNLVLYQDFDATDTSASGGNQLVETVSTDGIHFLPVTNSNTGALAGDCAGAAIQDCVTDNEGISGNQVVDPKTGNVFIAHTTTEGSSGTPGVRVSEGKVSLGTLPSATWAESPNLDGPLCPGSTKSADGSLTCVDSNGNPEEVAGENFATIAEDSAGYLYVTFTAGPIDHANSSDASFGYSDAPEQIYVVHSLEPVSSDPSKLTWSAPQRITGPGAGISAGTNTFPWITAGSDGRVDVAYYHTSELTEKGTCPSSGSGTCDLYGAGALTKAEWTVQMAQSLDAHAAAPSYTTANVSEAPVKHGPICTNGLGCTTGGDRSLGDFLQVTTDNKGAAVISYVFDTSADTSAGEDAGPDVISRQIGGPSLFASAGSVSRGSGPGIPMGSVTDPSGDADYSANGARTADTTGNLDLTGASLANGPNRTLIAKIDVKTLSTLTPDSDLGGADASWILRWTEVDPGTTGNGHIYYVGMDNAGLGGSGTPTFFAGDTAGVPFDQPGEHTKYMTFPQTHTLSSSQAAYDPKSGVITINVPLSDVGNPPNGKPLLSATAFTATAATPQSSTTLFNLIDATPPFDLIIGAPGTVGISPGSVPSTGGGPKPPRCINARGRLSGTGIGRFRLGMTVRKARSIDGHHALHGRPHEDFFCLRPIGIRAGYAYSAVLRGLSARQRRGLSGRIVFLSTADRRYSLHGVRPRTRLAAARRRVRLGRPIRIGPNTWYVVANGRSRGTFKVRHGIIEEVGIANRTLTANRQRTRRLLHALG